MQRRKFVVGLGSLAAGGAAAMGTGAFTSFEATRDFEVDLSGDTEAQVGLTPGNENGEYAQLVGGTSPDQTLAIELNGQAPGDGNGVNANAIYTFEDLFRIANQTPERKEFYIEFSKSGGAYSAGSNVSPGDIDIEFRDSGGNSLVGSSNSATVSPGTSLHVTFFIDTTGVPDNADISSAGQLLEEVTIFADDNP